MKTNRHRFDVHLSPCPPPSADNHDDHAAAAAAAAAAAVDTAVEAPSELSPVVQQEGEGEPSTTPAGTMRFLCGAGHPELVFKASLQQLKMLSGAATVANVTDMKAFFANERRRVIGTSDAEHHANLDAFVGPSAPR